MEVGRRFKAQKREKSSWYAKKVWGKRKEKFLNEEDWLIQDLKIILRLL